MTARQFRLNVQSQLPSFLARMDAPAPFHHALSGVRLSGHDQLILRGIHTARDLVRPPYQGNKIERARNRVPVTYPGPVCDDNMDAAWHWHVPHNAKAARLLLLSSLKDTNWHPLKPLYWNHCPVGKASVWQNQLNIRDCVRVFTTSRSILAPRYGAKNLRNSFYDPPQKSTPTTLGIMEGPVLNEVIRVYTDGSALHNGSPDCIAMAAWVLHTGGSNLCHVTGLPASNNTAEIVAIVLALSSWPQANLRIYTDSRFALRLVKGGLLCLENHGWIDVPWVSFPPGALPLSLLLLLKFLLFLLRCHQGSLSFEWVKAHQGDPLNEKVDKLAKLALHSTNTVDLRDFAPPPGWIDSGMTLAGTPLKVLTRGIVKDSSWPPLSKARCKDFLSHWSHYVATRFLTPLDAGVAFPHLWSLNVPPRLKELLWKETTGSLPLGASWFGPMDLGRICLCGSVLSLHHVWSGCRHHNISHLLLTLACHIESISYPYHDLPTTRITSWGHPWFPLLALKELENSRIVGKKAAKHLKASRPEREWAIGSYLWLLWTNKMNEVHSSHLIAPAHLAPALKSSLDTPPDQRWLC